MVMQENLFEYPFTFQLESGATIPQLNIAYTTYGKMNEEKDNVVWIFHALTANSKPHEWWPGLVGENKILDPNKYFIVCANVPGSCYGSSGPLEINPQTNEPYFHSFPFFTFKDIIAAFRLLQAFLGIEKIKIGIGGSIGGQQLLEWAVDQPSLFKYLIPIATNAVHSPWGKAFNASQRMTIEADKSWDSLHPDAGKKGMEAARSIALLSYRNAHAYNSTQPDKDENKIEHFNSESYQRYQGKKFGARFNAYSYYLLSKTMDSHNVGRKRGGVELALKNIQSKTLVISLEDDTLFPNSEQDLLAKYIPGAQKKWVQSKYGHDGFLLEYAQITTFLREFLQEEEVIVST